MIRSSSITEEPLLDDDPLLDDRHDQRVPVLTGLRRFSDGTLDRDTFDMQVAPFDVLFDQHGTFFDRCGNPDLVGDDVRFADMQLLFEQRDRAIRIVILHRESSADHIGETTGRGFLAMLAEA